MQNLLTKKETGQRSVALLLVISMLVWSVGLSTLRAEDSILPVPNNLSVTISDSAPDRPAEHVISFGFPSEAENMSSISSVFIDYDEAFDLSNLASDSTDGTHDHINVDIGGSETGALTNDSTAIQVATSTIELRFATPPDTGTEVTITVDGGADGTTGQIVSPDFTTSGDPLEADTYEMAAITADGTDMEADSLGSRSTRIAIIDNVTMQAAVDTIFEFSVSGLDNDVDINGATTTGSSTPTALNFGTIVHDEFYMLGHELSVETNAPHGFQVTVQESQELTSSTGEKIHRFVDAVAEAEGTGSPTTWTAPAGTLDTPHTFGHYGIITDDSALETIVDDGGDNDFGANEFVGNFQQAPRLVFAHDGAVTGTEENAGFAKVGVGLEISSLQAAGNDYTNTLTYVATPTF